MEEQADVAFKVTAFFIMMILGSFSILFGFHHMQQRNIHSYRKRQSFVDFLAGQPEEPPKKYTVRVPSDNGE